MQFQETRLGGAWLVELAPQRDHRGYFSRTFCIQEYAERGLEVTFVQHAMSYSAKKGTVRGMHFQQAPHSEVKVVSCIKGAIWDVIIDLRRGSPTFQQWEGFELSTENRRQLYIPEGFAHGFQTLSEDAEVAYLISEFYEPLAARGVRFNDPAFRIAWPFPAAAVSERDASWPEFSLAAA